MVKVIEEYVADLQKKTNRYVKLKNLPENISKKIFVTKGILWFKSHEALYSSWTACMVAWRVREKLYLY